MTSMPMYCSTCNAAYASTIFVSGNVQNFTLSNNISFCPKGHEARVIEGTFDIFDGFLSLRQGPDFSKSLLEQIQKIAKENISKNQPVKGIDEISLIAPELGRLLKVNGASPMQILAVVLFLSMQMLQLYFGVIAKPQFVPSGPTIIFNGPINIFQDVRPTITNEINASTNVVTASNFNSNDNCFLYEQNNRSKRKKRRHNGQEKARTKKCVG
jgi:hypothetical protein